MRGCHLLDTLSKALGSKEARGVGYIELRAERTVQTAIDVRQTGVDVLSKREETGHSARVLVDGVWGFAVSSGYKDVPGTIRDAVKAARALPSNVRRDRAQIGDVAVIKKRFHVRAKKPLGETEDEVKISYLKQICARTSSADPRIVVCKASYRDYVGEKLVVTSEGTSVESEIALSYLMTSVSGRAGSRLCSARDESAIVGSGWEFFEARDHAEVVSGRIVKKIKDQMDGISCRRGSFPTVLSPKVVGMLAHEALGHLSEADYFASGAFNGLQGKEVAPEFVTIIDSPRIADGFGNISVDDEGVKPRKVTLIDHGVLGEQLTNREWAERLGSEPTGNARAENYRVPPIIRMRNTYFEAGDMSVEELLEGVKFGYFCGDVKGGQAEANSSFQVAIQACFEIRDGELGRPVRDLAISGVAVRSLPLIDGMGRDFGIESSYCGKLNQLMATSDGGPHMRLKEGAIIFGGATE